MKKILLILAVFGLVLLPAGAFAQYYGSNYYEYGNYGNYYGYSGTNYANYYNNLNPYQNYLYQMPQTGSNMVNVTSCQQVGNDILISRNFETPTLLTSSIRDAGHGMRSYNLKCMGPTQYQVNWTQVGPTAGNPTYPTVPYTNHVSALDNSFSPKIIYVKAGTTVTWTNLGANPHTVTADNNIFNSGILSSGQTYSYQFNTPGTYQYYCGLHGAPGGIGMSGTVVVTN